MILLIAWGLVFLAGAMGELFDVKTLREVSDLKAIFLR